MGSSPDLPIKWAATRFHRTATAAGGKERLLEPHAPHLLYIVAIMTSTGSSRLRSVPIGTVLLLSIAGVLYVAMIGTLGVPGGGGAESSLEAAIESFLFTVLLWLMLALLLFAGGVTG